MRVRISHALVLCPDNGQTIGFNFLKRTSFVCTEAIFSVLHLLREWRPVDAVREVLPDLSEHDLRESVDALVEVGGLVVQGSSEEVEEREKIESWEWGIPSAMLHYVEQDRTFLSRQEAEAMQLERSKSRAAPVLFKLNTAYEKVTQLQKPPMNETVLGLMARRRTVREVPVTSLSLNALSDCLFAGMGITDTVSNCVAELPLSMTPSGGARNPYEAYVYAARIDGLTPGFYHYSAMEHSLGLVEPGSVPSPSKLVGDQPWIDDMSAIIFLCADFERTMWKYQDNNAYRVILIEAGHIGQNIMLAATERGLTACPSAALAHSEISKHLGLETGLHSPIYALMIGKPER